MRDLLACPIDGCSEPVHRHFSADSVPFGSIDAMGDDVTTDNRRADGSAGWNLGLPGVTTVVGTKANGKPKTAYRPLTNREVGSNRNAQEIAKRNNLTALDDGRRRPTPR